jgi:hypothetical protein
VRNIISYAPDLDENERNTLLTLTNSLDIDGVELPGELKIHWESFLAFNGESLWYIATLNWSEWNFSPVVRISETDLVFPKIVEREFNRALGKFYLRHSQELLRSMDVSDEPVTTQVAP